MHNLIATIFASLIATSASAEGHLAILIDRSPVAAPFPPSVARDVAAVLDGRFEYGDRLTIVMTGPPGAGAIDLEVEFDYRLGLKPDEITGILQPLIDHAAAHPDPNSDWVKGVEDISARMDCASTGATLVVVSQLANAAERDAEGGFTIRPAARHALTGCSVLFAGAGHATGAGDRRQIVNLGQIAADFWGATYVSP